MNPLFASLIIASVTTMSATAAKPKATFAPAPGAEKVNVDTRLSITFPSAPTIGDKGMIRIFDAATDVCIDSLDLSIPAGPTESTKLPKAPYTFDPYIYDQPRHTNRTIKPGTPSGSAAATSDEYQLNIIGGFTDAFHFYPIIVTGNKAEIYPHNNMLDYGRDYYVTVDPDVLVVDGKKFRGVTKKDGWRFSVRTDAPEAANRTVTVAADGSGDFNTVQGAMDFIPDFSSGKWRVFIKNGDYEELVYFRNKRNVTIEGENRDSVYIHYPNNEVFNPHPADVSTNEWLGTFPSRRAPFMMDNCTDMVLRNFTVATTCRGQAEGLLIMGEHNIVKDVTVIGDGDALQANGSLYMENCRIEGGGDTVLGRGPVYFKNCTLLSRGPFAYIRNGSSNHGDVFVDCTLIGLSPRAVFARTNGTYPHCEFVLIDCTLDDIPAIGWEGITKGPHDYVRFFEAGSKNPDGSPTDTSKRAEGSRILDSVKDRKLIDAYRNPEFVLGWRPGDIR
ncbi:pectinesterase family protein [uncultured Duncaniella sp.]|uniref:pectinesterase family protein n=2 Tax=uncultured Duncaniella sp. TaxID=2768039 RepID=UPI002611C100|nr:pectinesterase family protein [uncultured Duncaniella sp.]